MLEQFCPDFEGLGRLQRPCVNFDGNVELIATCCVVILDFDPTGVVLSAWG
jgi:hypothetical protein